MPISTSTVRAALRRRWVALLAGGAAVALAGGGATAAVAATAGPAPSASASVPCQPGVRALLRALPQSLKADLRHLRADAKGDRAADRAEIKKKALAGAYGGEIQRVAAIAAGSHGGLAAALPPALKADLKTLRSDAKGSAARKAEAATIWRKAIAGDYGATFESAAKRAEARVQQRCAAKGPGSGRLGAPATR